MIFEDVHLNCDFKSLSCLKFANNKKESLAQIHTEVEGVKNFQSVTNGINSTYKRKEMLAMSTECNNKDKII